MAGGVGQPHVPCRAASSGKELVRYREQGLALAAANDLLHRYRKRLYPYACRRCGYWHLTATPR